MSIISGLLNQNIDTVSSTSKDKYNDVTLTTVYSDLECRWEEKIGRTIGKDAEEKTYTVEVWIMPDYTVNHDYIITKDSKTYRVVGKENRYNLNGEIDHVKLFIA